MAEARGADMTDVAGDTVGRETPNATLQLRLEIQGATSISIQRRVQDSRFATRYFVGTGIDIGGGPDSLALFGEMFPLMRHVVVYDQQHGDAQLLSNVADNEFDFLYSSHCLEHVRDPADALGNWIRVVRPGGYLVISVPDEDLYEQGQWPSKYNGDHKMTFTLCKKTSWSPVSVNIFPLLETFAGVAQPLSVCTIDHAYRYRAPKHDQTRTPLTEAAIEIILRKI
jgi:SAM-dependent methyltransferase